MSSQTLLGFTNSFYKQPNYPAGKYLISQKCYDVYMVSKLMLSGRGVHASDISMYIGDELMFFDILLIWPTCSCDCSLDTLRSMS